MPRVNVYKPQGTQQTCDFCGIEAAVTVEMHPKQRNANDISFHMCYEHSRGLRSQLAVRMRRYTQEKKESARMRSGAVNAQDIMDHPRKSFKAQDYLPEDDYE